MKKVSVICVFIILFGHFTNAQNPDDLYQKFIVGYDSLDAQIITDLYTEEAEVFHLYENSTPKSSKGKVAILASFQEFFGYMKSENRTLHLTFKITNRQEVGENVLDNGFYKMVIKIPKKEDFVSYGKLSTVLAKVEGQWKFKTDANSTATQEEYDKAVSIKKTKIEASNTATNLNGITKFLTLEPNHSTIGFEVDIANGASKVFGKFMESDLRLSYVNSDWTKSSVNFSIKAASINTGIPDRDEHLRAADFFDVEKYPEITFISKKIEKIDDTHFIAIGTFTMHGVSKEMRLPFEQTYEKGNTIGIHLETIVNRIEHGVGASFKHSSIENFISENVKVKIDFWTKKDKRK